jgi:DNA-binding transcriptional regulator YhcF (GntR family)
LSHSTLQRNFRELKKLGWLELDKEKKVYKVNNYKIYSLRGAQTFTKKISEINKDEKGKIIEGLMSDRKNSQIKQICSSIQAPEDDSFNDCFSDSSNTFSNKLSKKLTDRRLMT